MEATLVDLKLMQEKKQLQTKNGRMHMLLKPIFNNSSVERVCNINSRRTCVARAMSGSRFIVNRCGFCLGNQSAKFRRVYSGAKDECQGSH
eukprot:1161795-Pelagomonas_calceolata.AAC.15